MKKALLILISLCCVIAKSQAQQEQQYSQYTINPFTINPAVAGTEDFIDLQLGYRSQWSSFEGAPKTTYGTVHGTLGKPMLQYHNKHEHHNWHGLGLQFYDDRTGPIQRNAVLAAYAYNMSIHHKTRLSVGSYAGFKQLKTDKSYWQNIDDETDNLFNRDLNTGLQPELQLGALLYNPDYFIMVSVQNLLGQNIDYQVEGDNVSDASYKRHTYISAGRKFKLTESTTLTPSTLLKYTPQSPLSVDLGLKMDYKNQLWYGFTTRVLESVNVFAGIQIKKQIDLSYAFESSYSKIRDYNSGTHEIIVGLRLKHPKNIICPSKFW